MQETRVQSLIQEYPTRQGATKPMRHSYWACAQETGAATAEAHEPSSPALQQEKALK